MNEESGRRKKFFDINLKGGIRLKALATNLCNNILVRGRREGIPITPMKLQKLMYYVCRDYAKETGESPITEDFEVWQYGPVLPSVYGEFKAFGSNPISEYAKDAEGNAFQVNEAGNPILSRIIDVVWAKYKRLSGIALSKKTHQSGSGWYTAYMNNLQKISVEDMINDRTE